MDARRLSVGPHAARGQSDGPNDAETRQVAPRHRPVGRVPVRAWRQLRDSAQGITKQAIRRLARRGGVKRMGSDQSGDIYTETRGALKVFLRTVLEKAILYTGHAHRLTVTTMDIVMGLKANGVTLYGHGGCFPIAERAKAKAANTQQQQQQQSATTPPPTGATPPPPPQAQVQACPQGHGLVRAPAGNGLRCDECRGKVKSGADLHSCETCDYDRCDACQNGEAGGSSRRRAEIAAAPPRAARVALVRTALQACFGSHGDSCSMGALLQQLPKARPAPAPPFEEEEVRGALKRLEVENVVMYREAQSQIYLI